MLNSRREKNAAFCTAAVRSPSTLYLITPRKQIFLPKASRRARTGISLTPCLWPCAYVTSILCARGRCLRSRYYRIHLNAMNSELLRLFSLPSLLSHCSLVRLTQCFHLKASQQVLTPWRRGHWLPGDRDGLEPLLELAAGCVASSLPASTTIVLASPSLHSGTSTQSGTTLVPLISYPIRALIALS